MGRLDLPDPIRDEDIYIPERVPEHLRDRVRSGMRRAGMTEIPKGRPGAPIGGGEVLTDGLTGQLLTEGEIEVLWAISHGRDNKTIAVELNLSSETVKSRVRRILLKLKANSRTHAVAIGLRSGVIQ